MLRREYRYPFSAGVPERSYSTPLFTLRYRRRARGSLRCAVVISKKVDAHSNVRHQVKRVVLDMVEEMISEIENTSFDLVFYAKRPLVTAERESLMLVMRKGLVEAGIIQ